MADRNHRSARDYSSRSNGPADRRPPSYSSDSYDGISSISTASYQTDCSGCNPNPLRRTEHRSMPPSESSGSGSTDSDSDQQGAIGVVGYTMAICDAFDCGIFAAAAPIRHSRSSDRDRPLPDRSDSVQYEGDQSRRHWHDQDRSRREGAERDRSRPPPYSPWQTSQQQTADRMALVHLPRQPEQSYQTGSRQGHSQYRSNSPYRSQGMMLPETQERQGRQGRRDGHNRRR